FFTVFNKFVLVVPVCEVDSLVQSAYLLSEQSRLCRNSLHVQSAECHSRFQCIPQKCCPEASLRSKDVCFILHTVLPHFKDIELFEPADSNRFFPVENIVTHFAP
ncbi:MAG: hypothetical protein V8S08_08240, partial [Lachnoclostridium sp.]